MHLLEATYLSVFGIGVFLGLFHVLAWTRLRDRDEVLFASFMSFGAGLIGLLDAAALWTNDIDSHQRLLEFQNVGVGLVLVSLVWFLRIRLGSGRSWFAWSLTVAWTGLVTLSLASPGNLTFIELTSVSMATTMWGETYHVPQGLEHPLYALAGVSTVAVLVFCIDVTVDAFRKGARRDALRIGGPALLFVGLGGYHSGLVDSGSIETPYLVSFFFLLIAVSLTFSLVEDVVATARLTRQLALERDQWTKLLSEVQLAVVRIDSAGRIAYANPFLETISGWSHEDLLGKDPSLLYAEEERSELRRIIAESRNWTSRANQYRRLRTRMGDFRDMVWFSVTMRNDRGEPDGIVAFGQDFTEQLAVQLDRDQAREELERLSRALTMGEMASAFAHELSQPIAAILSNAQTLEMMSGDSEADRTERSEILADIIHDTRRARDLMDRVRAFIFNSEPEKRRFDLGEMISESVEMLRHEARKRSVRVDARSPETPVSFVGARTELQQVVMNLLLNAIQAAGAAEGGQVEVRWRSTADGNAEIAISDNGSGLPEEIAGNVMKPFVTTKTSGSGIGLAVSRRVARRHDGDISTGASELGGARFVVSLPILADVQVQSVPVPQVGASEG